MLALVLGLRKVRPGSGPGRVRQEAEDPDLAADDDSMGDVKGFRGVAESL